MRTIINYIINSGINYGYSDELKQHIQIANIFIFVSILVTLPFFVIYRKIPLMLYLTFMPTVFYIISFFFIKYQKNITGRFIFSISGGTAIYIIGIFIPIIESGDLMASKFIIFGTVIFPFALFKSDEWKFSLTGIIVIFIYIFSFEAVNNFWDLNLIKVDFDSSNFKTMSVFVAFVGISGIFFIYKRKFLTLNKKITKSNKSLFEKNHELKTAEEELTQSNEELQILNEQLKTQKEIISKDIQTKDKFFSIIAHDLRTPFNSILGFSELLVTQFDEFNNDEQKEYINIIHDNAEKIYKLVENLLLWSRSQRGILKFNPEEINIYSLSETITEIFKGQAENKSITIINKISKKNIITADKGMLATILRNLISNAIKFTTKGGEIILDSENIKTKNEQYFIEITINDSGVGISEEIQKDLFNIAKNVSTEGTENELGTGLGLILCKEFAEKHGGKINVKSKLGKGSEFILLLPKKYRK